MSIVIGLVVGAVLGSWLLGRDGGALGGLVGLVIGAIMAGRRKADSPRPEAAASESTLLQRIRILEERVADLEVASRRWTDALPESEPMPVIASAQAPSTVRAVQVSPSASVPGEATTPAPSSAPLAASAAGLNPDGTRALPPRADARRELPFPPPRAPEVPPNPVWAWIVGGNTLARLGVLLLFIGVGFLLKYAAEHVQVPISVRLSGVALGAVALLVVGWRLRLRRRAYAMVLQGGGVGVLYLTVFAALRLYALMPPVAAFVLMLWISALSSWLAVRQDAISLAALAVVGGFLAPILTSSNSGNHVMLFTYYAMLNAGILGIAWFKAWRSLNLLGFVFTFLVGTIWGVTRYQPENFASTEPFLILFFLFYVAIAVLYALRRSVEVRSYVDAGLVFGTPLVAAGLQSALVRDIEYGMAYSALAMAAVYLALGRFLWSRHREDIRMLVESFLALGVVFATLAVPLGLDARWTSAIWAVEGAAIVWAGIRQRRAVIRGFGLLLELGAGAAFLSGLSLWAPAAPPAPILFANSAFIGAMLVALAGLFTAWQMQRDQSALPEVERSIAGACFAWGLLWWLYAFWREIDGALPRDAQVPAVVMLLAATAAAFAAIQRPLRWPTARMPGLLLLPALGAVAVFAVEQAWLRADTLLSHGGFVAWPLAVAVVVALLFRFDRDTAFADDLEGLPLAPWHAGLFWLVLLLFAHTLAWLGQKVALGHGVWTAVPWGVVPAVGLGAVCALAAGARWPFGAHRRAYVLLGGTPVAVLLALWSLAASMHGDGDPAPLTYVPVLNPLDIAQAIVLTAGTYWLARLRREHPRALDAVPRDMPAVVLSALVFLWVNAIALRTLHFWYDVPYTPQALWNSTLVQATLSLLWSAIALTMMVWGNRREFRAPWMAGAALLGVVVVKLFLVELSQVGTITRIVSFIGVGLLLLLIGYLAPVPSRKEEMP